jgi:50S ribosomal protein L16 3-hydroxylase
MPGRLAILEAMPPLADFYGQYWNSQPFVVRQAVSGEVIDGLIDADELAGLSMQSEPMSRMVKVAGADAQWSCRFGPFTEQDFKETGEQGWSLLVQNVEQFHPETATLLRHFNFAPRWLMDDIMVSYSACGGSVGPHLDSHHVFLVQGPGRRRWKVGQQKITEETYIEGLDLRVLKDDFTGDEVEVGLGDVLYLPPKFAHQGITLEPSLTFSIGFLGPKLSELFAAYGQYLCEHEDLDRRYLADGLKADSAGFTLAPGVVDTLRGSFAEQLESLDFSRWLVAFFSEGGVDDFGNYIERDEPLNASAFKGQLKQGAILSKPEYVKLAVTKSASGKFVLGFEGQSFDLGEDQFAVIKKLINGQPLKPASTPELLDHAATLKLLRTLYNHQGLELSSGCT